MERDTRGLRVALDRTALGRGPSSSARRVSALISALSERPELDLSGYSLALPRGQRGRGAPTTLLGESEQRHMPSRILLGAWTRGDHPRLERFLPPFDLVHGTDVVVPPTKRAARLLTIWDLIFVSNPEELGREGEIRRRLALRAIRSGAVVHAATLTVADEVREHLGARRDQVVTIHPGLVPLAAPDHDGAARLLDLSVPIILAIGAATPRRDLPSLVAAFDALASKDRDLHLVLICPPGAGDDALRESIERSHASGRILRTGPVSGGVLAALLTGARALASPSHYEGFVSSPLQAMQAGVPVVAARGGSMTELTAGAALIVPPGDVDDLAGALDVAVADEAQRSVLITAGRARVEDFAWDRAAGELSALYRRLAGR